MFLKYKISVIIPTFNAEDYLLEAFESIKNQSMGFESIEVILVDDKSSDKTPDLIKELSKEYENVKSIILEENTGTASKPRNEGIKNASSSYIMFLDNDDVLYPKMCEVMYDAIDSNGADVVSCRYNIDSKKSSKSPYSFLDNFNDKKFKDFKGKYENGKIYLNNVDDFPSIMTLGHPTMIWTKIFRRLFLLENNIEFPVGDLYEDVYFSSKSYMHANGIVILNDFWGYGYQLRTEGENKSTCQVFTPSLVQKQLRGFLKIMDMIGDDYPQLKNELIVDMTKIYIYADLNKKDEKDFLKSMKPFYKKYSLFGRIRTANPLFNAVINIFIKLFSFSDKIASFSSKLYTKIKD